jgi:hypothetical protein
MKVRLLTAIGICSALALGCASERRHAEEPDTSKETEEAVEAVGTEIEQGAEDTGEAIEEGVNDAAEEVEEETED